MYLNRTLLILAIGITLLGGVAGQTYLMNGSPINDCSGFFLDSGGTSGRYDRNENFTTVICPDMTTGTHIKLIFTGVELRSGDELCFYDDNTANPARLLSCAKDFEPGSPFIIQATAQNPTGCITVTFKSNNSGQAEGWSATITCVPACQSIISTLVSSVPEVSPADTGWIDICPGDRVFLKAEGKYPQNNTIYNQSDASSSFEWDFGDGAHGVGPEISHIYNKPGGYKIQLFIKDLYNCTSTNYISQRVRVAPKPTFQIGENIDYEICVGDTIQLNSSVGRLDTARNVSVITNSGRFTTGGIVSDSLPLPDGTGSAYSSAISINGFTPGQVLQNISDLEGICVNIEHSWMRDLEISITCPNGTSVKLHDHPGNIGAMVLLGQPIDNDGINPTPGVGYDYCWTSDATRGTWLSYANGTFGLFNPGTLPPGNYNSYQALTDFIGCPLNGDWTIRVQDLWAQDNGFIFSWSINFRADLFPDLEAFQPVITQSEWLTNASIFHLQPDTIAAAPHNAGNISYNYRVLDDFGCTYDTSLVFTVLPETHPDCRHCQDLLRTVPDTTVCLGNSAKLDVARNDVNADMVTFESFPNEAVGFDNYPPANPLSAKIGVNSILPLTLTNPLTQIESVCLDISTDFVWDLQVYLESPSGRRMELTTNNGGLGSYTGTCFTPVSTNSIRTGVSPFTGNYKPEGDWNVLTGSPLNGNWKLLVGDAAGPNQFGTLNQWSISFNTQNQVTYTWTNPATLSCSNCPDPIATPSQTTTYTVQATDDYGCKESRSMEVKIFSQPAPSVQCAGSENGIVSFEWQPMLGATYYEVNLNNTGWTQTTALTFSSGNFNPGDWANLQIRAYLPGVDCYTDIGTTACRYIACEVQAVVQATSPTCFGLSDGYLTVNAANGLAPYRFSLNGSAFQADSTFRNLPEGNYTIIVEDNLTCRDTLTYRLTQPAEVKINAAVQQEVSCFRGNNGRALATASGGDGNFTYLWSDPLAQISALATQLRAGSYTVTATDSKGCRGIATVTIREPADLQLALTATDVRCRGESSGSATVVGTGGTAPFTYQWNDQASQTAPTASNLPAGTYTVIVTDANQCVKSSFISINQPTSAVQATATQTFTGCDGGNNSQATVVPTGGNIATYTYAWSNGQTSAIATNLRPGVYVVTVMDGNACRAIDTVSITEFEPVRINLVVVQPTCFSEKSGRIGVTFLTGGLGVGWQWKWNTGETANFIGNLEGDKTYSITATDAQGCTGDTSVFLRQPLPLEMTTSSLATKCFGSTDGEASVNQVKGGKPGFKYLWDNRAANQTDRTATGLGAGFYSVTVTDSLGCQVFSTVEVKQPARIVSALELSHNPCFGDSKGTAKINSNGGTPGASNAYQYTWSNGKSGNFIDNLRAGKYFVTTTDANICQVVDSMQILEAEAIVASLSTVDVSCYGDKNGRIIINTSGGIPPFQYSLNGSGYNGSSTIIGLGAAEYEVYVRDAKGCTWLEKATISEPQKFEVDAGPPFVEIELGENIMLTGSSIHGQGIVQYIWNPPYPGTLSCTICESTLSTPMYSTVYELYAQDEMGCDGRDRIEVRVTKKRGILVPTGFSPNGDATNDRLLVHGREGTKIKLFRIFDRWGELVFEASDFLVNDPGTGWDGTFRSETMMPGVYMWYAEVEYIDGAREDFWGQTTLVR